MSINLNEEVFLKLRVTLIYLDIPASSDISRSFFGRGPSSMFCPKLLHPVKTIVMRSCRVYDLIWAVYAM